MKAIVCEMCGSQDLVKKDGMFVCQNCGTKYAIEEAKKLLVEGTVKIDNRDSIENYLRIASSACESGNNNEAENYCNKIIEIDSENYKAWFIKGKAAGWQSTLAKIRLDETLNCFSKAVDFAPEEEKEAVKKQSADEMDKLSMALVTLCCNNYAKSGTEHNADELMNCVRLVTLYSIQLLVKCGVSGNDLKEDIAEKIHTATVDSYNKDIVTDYWGSTKHPSEYAWETYTTRTKKAIDVLMFAIELNGAKNKENIWIYKNIISLCEELEPSGAYSYGDTGWYKSTVFTKEAKTAIIDVMMACHQAIHELDSSYVIPSRPSTSTSSGCYVATAVYGSYDCPQVWTLRRYRDYTLAETWYGRLFIHTYYAVSPTLVAWFGNKAWFKKLWKPKLDKMVKKLNEAGVDNTPYADRTW